MIIRSQDKTIITTNLNLWVSEEVVGYEIENDDFKLGAYSTKEKAIKVLDMVQKFYAVYELAKVGRKVPNNEVTDFGDMIFGCFDMPQDSEV